MKNKTFSPFLRLAIPILLVCAAMPAYVGCDRGPDYTAGTINRSTVEGAAHAICCSLMNPHPNVINRAFRYEDHLNASKACNNVSWITGCGGLRKISGCVGVPSEYPECSISELENNLKRMSDAIKSTNSKCECVASGPSQVTCKTYKGVQDVIDLERDENGNFLLPLHHSGVPVMNAYKRYLLDEVVNAVND